MVIIDREAFVLSLSMLLSWDIPLFCIAGLILGIILGVIPGVSGIIGLAIMIGPTCFLEPIQAILFLSGIFTGSCYGGGLTAILLNIPGQPSSLVTSQDGYPLTKQGRQNEALGVGLMSSAIGCFAGYFVILFILAPIGRFVLKFGPAEMLALFCFALTIVGAIGGNIRKALLVGLLGVLLATIGASPHGRPRGIYGLWVLYEGIPIEPVLIGLLTLSELPFMLKRKFVVQKIEKAQRDFHSIIRGMMLALREKATILRSIFIGIGVGILPAAGASIASVVSYGRARRASKHPERFGHGEVAGVVASEIANNSAEPGSMATMMCLGIPGGAGTAILMAAFVVHGMSPGPYLIRDNLHFAYALILANFLQAFLLVGLGLIFIYYLGRVVFIETKMLIPIIVAASFVGILSLRGQVIDLCVVVIFGVLGYLMKKYDYPLLAFIIGFILGGRVEEEFIRTKLLFSGQYYDLLHRPIFMAFLFITIGSVIFPYIKRHVIDKKT
ncbi:MAG: tripartite tricarboxylate transporter permease [Deltaproteobacteria bacterium]|nr:tripartite tricarboxylate transporter permease [Deltaproteobacteria bacterium]